MPRRPLPVVKRDPPLVQSREALESLSRHELVRHGIKDVEEGRRDERFLVYEGTDRLREPAANLKPRCPQGSGASRLVNERLRDHAVVGKDRLVRSELRQASDFKLGL